MSGAWIVNAGRPDQSMLASKATNVHLHAGDSISMLTSGGGGFGTAKVDGVVAADPAAVGDPAAAATGGVQGGSP